MNGLSTVSGAVGPDAISPEPQPETLPGDQGNAGSFTDVLAASTATGQATNGAGATVPGQRADQGGSAATGQLASGHLSGSAQGAPRRSGAQDAARSSNNGTAPDATGAAAAPTVASPTSATSEAVAPGASMSAAGVASTGLVASPGGAGGSAALLLAGSSEAAAGVGFTTSAGGIDPPPGAPATILPVRGSTPMSPAVADSANPANTIGSTAMPTAVAIAGTSPSTGATLPSAVAKGAPGAIADGSPSGAPSTAGAAAASGAATVASVPGTGSPTAPGALATISMPASPGDAGPPVAAQSATVGEGPSAAHTPDRSGSHLAVTDAAPGAAPPVGVAGSTGAGGAAPADSAAMQRVTATPQTDAPGDVVAGSQRVVAAADGRGISATTSTAGQSQLPGVASQLVSVLSPLRTGPGGTQSVTVLLHPAELGDVRATVTVSGDQVTVRLLASTTEGASALRSALPDLHSGLSQDGQRSTVLLGDPGAGDATTSKGETDGGATYESATPGTAPAPLDTAPVAASAHPIATATVHRLLDIRL
jgi:flagellar hook-length control protein FliK